MRPMLTRSTQAAVCITALVTLAACSGDADGEKTSTSSASSSTSSASSEPTYGEDHIMTEVRKADKAFRALDPNAPIPKDADWVTDEYRKAYNADNVELKNIGLVQKGKTTTKSLHLDKSDPDAPGGWYVTVYNCNVSTMRAYIDGEDVSRDPHDEDKPLPKGPRDGVSLDRYTTPDDGKSWQIDDSQIVSAADAKDSPCA
ncbi:hypothetical protein [Janibacter hoylei]|uniref:hypothetical protein n=1 Tax=Janibacter hoylei TaxID=364298 RepID=UPI0021A87171|nr:hypothetical protein [Janibacter hoylei]MCT1618384.1 hypothetical protein [Janibacter hoylei]MCT2294488.1 hypothetical protein [Janibacter hoylei]